MAVCGGEGRMAVCGGRVGWVCGGRRGWLCVGGGEGGCVCVHVLYCFPFPT